MIGQSWTHKIARVLVKPLVSTWVTPNHLTTLRIVTGIAACGLFAAGTREGDIWGGVIWLVSAFLDRADGELARIGGKTSEWGHRYDFFADELVNSLFFVAIGFGLRNSATFGEWAPLVGIWTGVSLFLAGYWSEKLMRYLPPESKAYSGIWGFDFDDLLYLLAPLAWLGWLVPVLIGACVVTPLIAILTAVRLWRASRPRTK